MAKRPKGWLIDPKQVDKWLEKAEEQAFEQDFEGAERTARRVLRYVPQDSEAYGEAHFYVGVAQTMREDFEQAYQSFSRAMTGMPDSAEILYDRAMAARMTTRTGQAVVDLRRAVELADDPEFLEMCREELAMMEKIVQEELADRGPDFTLEELLTQQETFQRGVRLMEAEKWTKAEAAFRRVIEMGDVLPQPWGNLGVCLIRQEQFDEAEEALRRALEMEPLYSPARRNLDLMPKFREGGSKALYMTQWRGN